MHRLYKSEMLLRRRKDQYNHYGIHIICKQSMPSILKNSLIKVTKKTVSSSFGI